MLPCASSVDNASKPTATFLSPVVKASPASLPIRTLSSPPLAILAPAFCPMTTLSSPDVVVKIPVDVKVPFSVRPVSAVCVIVISLSVPNPRTALSDLSVTLSVKFTSSVPVGICITAVSASFFMVTSFVVP